MYSLDYIAGLIDADGSISISVSKNRYKRKDGTETSKQFAFVVNFRQVAKFRNVVEELQETLGIGKIYDFNQTGRSQPMVTWQTTKEEETLYVCQTLLPHLHIKDIQAQFMIEALTLWIENRGDRKGAGYRRPEWVKDRILEISSLMNEGQQKSTSRRNKEIREEPESLGYQILVH